MIAGAGFAAMAWRLACSRSESLYTAGRIYYASRGEVQSSPPGCYPAHREYYRIIDEAETGLRIWHSARRRGWPTSVKVIL